MITFFEESKKNKRRKKIFVTFFKIQDIRGLKKREKKNTHQASSFIRRSRSHFDLTRTVLLTNCTTFLRQLNPFSINCVIHILLLWPICQEEGAKESETENSQIKRTEKECAYSEPPTVRTKFGIFDAIEKWGQD